MPITQSIDRDKWRHNYIEYALVRKKEWERIRRIKKDLQTAKDRIVCVCVFVCNQVIISISISIWSSLCVHSHHLSTAALGKGHGSHGRQGIVVLLFGCDV